MGYRRWHIDGHYHTNSYDEPVCNYIEIGNRAASLLYFVSLKASSLKQFHIYRITYYRSVRHKKIIVC